ncbi:TIGR02281 family clan AA aspartic protease [uncultured Litoreibacter sp.]|uniref:retropepsin-like aspartic protease family protein n=1 Tax=uncultured Litoreibacter sp. TaxID=1392394 RepID=UPI002626A4CD|nr:TIGR02281 family clan AA aspartic protease [uncultured Litoreibacter sp.]
MSGDETGRLIYLVLLGCVIGSYFFVSGRKQLGETARAAALWVFIFLGVIVGYGLWNDVKQTVLPQQTVFGEQGVIEAPRRGDGHFYLTMTVGDVPVEFVVDTGATDVVLSMQDAARIGINEDELVFSGQASTANGIVRTARVRLEDVRVGDLDEGTVRASVNEGDLETSLLGMSYLQRFGRIEIRGDTLLLER